MGEGKKNALRVTRMEKIMLCKHLYGNVSLKRGIKLHSKQFFSMTFSLMLSCCRQVDVYLPFFMAGFKNHSIYYQETVQGLYY